MRRRDWAFISLLAAALAGLLSPVLLRPRLIAGNFGDIYAYHFPLQHAAAEALISGRLPFWNPYIFSGMPLLANSQAAVFYPAAVLFRIFPLAYAFTLYAFVHLCLAVSGAYLFFRRLKLEPAAAAVFAAGFALSPFLLYRIAQGIPTHLAALAYVPWCWLALVSGGRGFLALVWSLQFLSGHPQFPLINAAGMGFFAAARALGGRGEFLKDFILEGGMAAALCLAQWVPTAEFLSESNRAAVPAAFKTVYSMTGASFLTLLWPAAFGDPVRGTFASAPSVFFELKALYVGLLPLMLAALGLAALWRKTDGWRWAAAGFGLAAAGAFLALGGNNPLFAVLTDAPVAGLSRTPARYSLLTLWGLLLAASAGWKFLTERKPAAALKAAALCFVLVDLALWGGRFIYAEDPDAYLAPNPVMTARLAGRAERFATGPDVANPDKAMLYRAMNVNGYDAFYLDSYTRYAARSEGGPAGDPSRMYLRKTGTPEMRALGVSHFLSAEARPEPSVAVAGAARLYQLDGALPLLRLVPGDGDVVVENPVPEKWAAHGAAALGGGRLVLAVPDYPGWRAYFDGVRVPVSTFDGLFVSALMPPRGGAFSAYFIFRPTGWNFLAAAAAAAWLCFAAAAIRGRE